MQLVILPDCNWLKTGMLFNSITYGVFLTLVVTLYWLVPHRFRALLLLVASSYFYMSWLPVYGVLLSSLTIVNYALGNAIDRNRETSPQNSRFLLWLGIAGNLSCLAYFKYYDFILNNLNQLLTTVSSYLPPGQSPVPLAMMNVILPLGISFFVFEFIHYLTDIYRGSRPISKFSHFFLFAAFFPSQIAGPIKRFQDFSKQLEYEHRFSLLELERGLRLILIGLFKKVAIADNLAKIASIGFDNANNIGSFEALVAALAFTIQIYCDFSGYTDMGRGSAIMMGFDLPQNFNLPYLARDLSDFWKRWHISLSSWLRDYLYIPLGGSRCSFICSNRNLLITMVLGGLWHGASWHFVAWGAFHGVGLVCMHTYQKILASNERLDAFKRMHASKPGIAAGTILTFIFVVFGWILFRAETLPQAIAMMGALFHFNHVNVLGASYLKFPGFIALAIYLAAGAALYGLQAVPGGISKFSIKLHGPTRAIAYVAFFVAAVGLSPAGQSPFIYFQF